VSFSLWQLFAAGVGYLLILFLLAYAADRGKLPRPISHHPLTHALSLGVYASSWSFYGSVGFAEHHGYLFLTIYLGVTIAFLLAPLLLAPLLRLIREQQLSSLADLFAFRYQSQLAGVLVTLFMLAGTLPYIALQIRAVTASLQVLTGESTPALLALGFCATMVVFAVLFGARHLSPREKHTGLVVAIAFESLVKLLALLLVGGFALFGVFDGPFGLERWLDHHPEALAALYQPLREGPWNTLLLLAFAAAFLLPRQFHMTFTEQHSDATFKTASWALPLFLLLLNLSIPPILWASQALALTTAPDYHVLGLALQSGSALLPIVTFLGGLSAASAMMIVTTLALASMCMNHLLLPLSFPTRLPTDQNIYRWLLWGRRLLIAVIIAAGYGFYLLLQRNQELAQLGLIAFVAVAQFLPGVVGLLYWRRATRAGFISGLLAGAALWALLLLLPLLQRSGVLPSDLMALLPPPPADEPWSRATTISLSLNALLFVAVSLRWPQDEEERAAAAACCRESLQPLPGVLIASSLAQMTQQLALVLGPTMATQELDRARHDLGITATCDDPTLLRRLRERIERNLSGLFGPLLARMIVNERLQMDPRARTALSASMRHVEQRLAQSHTLLQGLAAELDQLRRYHQQVLQDLPLGVCSVGPDEEVVSWNGALANLTGISAAEAIGAPLTALPAPWSGLLGGFLRSGDGHLRKVRVRSTPHPRMFSLHKAAIDSAAAAGGEGLALLGGSVILVEDLTDLSLLEGELAHSERLASIGRLAAGVAHEIGNPVTAIASLGQNLLVEQDDPAFVEQSLQEIVRQTRRISTIVRSLVSFSHSGGVEVWQPQRMPLCPCIDEARRLLQLSHAGRSITFIVVCDAALQVDGDPQQLVQVFLNLLSNACDASQPGDQIEVVASSGGGYVTIDIIDQGEGIPEALQEQVFEPFFTTKQPGEGTGLGLPLVYNIMTEHAGTVTLSSTPGGGTRIRLRLPDPVSGERNRRRQVAV